MYKHSNAGILVADTENNRVAGFTSSGGFVGSVGSEGTGAGQFHEPDGVVSDSDNNRVEEFQVP